MKHIIDPVHAFLQRLISASQGDSAMAKKLRDERLPEGMDKANAYDTFTMATWKAC